MDDLISRQAALDDLVTFILDEVWDEELWELNWRSFPEIICRKMVRLGYVKQTEEGYERLPTVEPKKGRDICMEVPYHCEFKCSLCGAEIQIIEGMEGCDFEVFNYCPNCGARMEET